MIKKLSCSDSGFRFLLSVFIVAVVSLMPGSARAQQVIGSFPQMDGGFEGQTAGALTVTSVATGVQRTDWTVQNAAPTATINASGGRSGSKYVTFGSSSATAYRLQSPTAGASAIATSTSYTVQVYYRIPSGTTAGTNFQRAISNDGTASPGAYSTATGLPVNGNAWTQLQTTVTSGTSSATPRYGVGVMRYNTASAVNVEFDDYVIYAGAADNTAPASAGTVTVSNATATSLDVSWGAAASVDGGGYMVVRYSVNPNADNDPNQQGIYAVGNTITNGTGSLVGTVRYIGTGTSFTDNTGLVAGTQYWYKVYTVDKAFNYASEVSGNGTTVSSGSTPPSLTAAVGATVDAAFNVTFTDDAAWRSAITGITVNGTALTGGYAVSAGQITFTPSASVPTTLLQTSGTKSIVVSATGYSTATVSQAIGAGIPNRLAITTQPTAPATNGAALATQPVVAIRDQYGNATTSTASITAAVGAGTWVLGGTTSVAAVSGTTTFTNLTATSMAAVTGATIVFSSGSLTGATSNTFNIPVPAPANDNCAGAINLTVDAAAISGTFAGSSAMTGATRPDVFYMFTPTITGTHTITVNNFSVAADKDFYVYSVCPSTYSTTVNVVASGATSSTTSETASATFNAGTSYKILVQDFNSSGGTFSIAVTGPPPTLAVTPTSIAFGGHTVGSTTVQQFSLSGTALTGYPGNITVTAPNSEFQVSNDNSTWGASTTVAYTSATLSATNVYVRFVPQSAGAKSGNVTLSGGGAATPPTVALTGTGTLANPVTTVPTNIGQTQFDANWNPVTGATGYLLDVSLSPTFGTPGVLLTESFTGTTFPPTGWAATGWTRSTTAADYNSGPAAAIGSSNSGTLTTLALSNPTNMTFYLGRSTNATAKTLEIEVSTTSQTSGFTPIATFDHNNVPSGSYNQYTVDLSAYAANATVYIRFTKTATTTSPWRLDDIVVNGIISSYISGYNALPVTGTTHTVSGLTPYTTYYYRVRATASTETSGYSNTQSVLTAPETVIWDGTSWSNTTGPDFSKNAEIQGAYNTIPNGDITALGLKITPSGALTISSGSNVTVVNAVENEALAAAFLIENNASLIQINDQDNVGEAVVKRNSASIMRLDYTLWSSPVVGNNLLDFSPSTLTNRFYIYNPVLDQYNSVTPSETDFADATGYLIRMPNDHPTTPTVWEGTFVGQLHNGAYSVSVPNNTYNAVGNPYPSVIDADLFINANGISEALYFWRKTNNAATSSYATYTIAGGTGTSSNPGDPLNLVPNGFIQTGQGFLVRSTSTSITFNNNMRVSNYDNQFLRASAPERHRLWLNLTNSSGLFSQTMVAYMAGATAGVDATIDGHYFNDSQNALTSLIGTEEFAIQGRSLPFQTSDVVPLGFKSETAGTFTIGLDHVDGLFAQGQQIYLRDNLTNAVHNLSESAYVFTTEAGVSNSRFEIVYDSALSVENPTAMKANVIVYTQDEQLIVNGGNIELSAVSLYDISGRLLMSATDINATQASFKPSVRNQVLLVKITTRDGQEISKKIVY